MKKSIFSASAGFTRRHGPEGSPGLLSSAAGFSLPDFWRQNNSAILLGILALIVVIVLAWLIFRRRRDEFPEIRLTAAPPAAAKEDMTQLEIEPQPAVRSSFSPGIFGKIEVRVNEQPINTYLITDNPLTIGRDPAQALAIIQEAIVSKLHCTIFYRGGRIFIKDLNSTNGTFVNDEKVGERELLDNDVVSLGKKGTIKIIYHK
ncbi:MAG TPA: FHA domain-containing protein [Candidatus Binatia bacterium]|nr:FHA domain-containing protein [Candidatus Binatia bacterium]